jgi:hypothetical protein
MRHTMAGKKWWFAGSAALLILTVTLVMEWPGRQQPHQRAAPALPEAAAPARPAAVARVLPSRTTNSTAPQTPSETGKYELCGVGKAPAQITADDLNEYVLALTQKTGDPWRAALLDSSDLRARAMGLLSRHTESKFHRTEQADEPAAKPTEDEREELVQLAAGGSDPVVYAAAAWICESGTPQSVQAGACRRISLRGWTRIDPDNAIAWLDVAMEDRSRGDLQAEAADFARAARAHRSDLYQDSLLRAALAEVPRDATPLARVAQGTEFVGILSVQPLLELTEASRFCSTEGLHHPERHEPCEALARLWVNQGSSLLELGLGKAIGRRLGWTPERLSELDQELNAMMSLARGDASDPWSCQNVARDRQFLEGRAQRGELNFLRGMLERAQSPPAADAPGAPGPSRPPEFPKP